MKKFFLSAVAVLTAFCLYGQECSTMWPYIYPEFQDGILYKKDGTKFELKVNVHVLHGRLHYLDDGLVKEALSGELLLVQVGEDNYMDVNGDIMKVMVRDDRGFVAAHILGDFDKLRESGGAYGTSTNNSATQKLTSIQVAGHVNQNHMEMWEKRHNGELIDLVYKYYLVTPAKVWPASRRGIEQGLSPERKAEFKNWLKAHRIKWNDPASLVELMDFLVK